MGWTAIDAHWWFGGNKRRGIGQYLRAYFQGHCHIPRTQRRWIVPFAAQESEIQELLALFGGEVVRLPQSGADASWVQAMVSDGCNQIFFASPFERPHSLLDVWPLFAAAKIRSEAILFDLLPLQFPQEILSFWPSKDQLEYSIRVEYLKQLDFLWCISPATQQAATQLLGKELQKSKVLTFGLKTQWIPLPENIDSTIISRDPHVVLTISGGEWRKNLDGTIDYFLKHFPKTDTLVVICALGKKQKWILQAQLFMRGVLNRVKLLGEVSEEEKWHWLFTAHSFLFLSRAEGLGIPLLEAQKAKIPNIYMSTSLVKDGLGVLVHSPKVVEL